jgi:DNA transformation protein
MSINELASLPNIGKTLVEKLSQVGIKTPKELKSIGSENTFIKLKTVDNDACLNMLFAIEGAIQGIRWHDLDEWKKKELKEFYDYIKKARKPDTDTSQANKLTAT